jgi:DNA-directed RNA polymerase specialized sigma24 family protein
MSAVGSVTYWLQQLQAGEQEAFQQLWERYFERLVGLARQKLRGAPGRAADEEDVALSAFDSFFRGAREGRFPQLLDRDDLWQVLVVIAGRKAVNLALHERRLKRGGGKVWVASDLAAEDSAADGPTFAALIGRELDPGFAVQVAEECRRLLESLGDGELRAVALWKMEGYTNEEIAAKMGRKVLTVTRKLNMIRRLWEKELHR